MIEVRPSNWLIWLATQLAGLVLMLLITALVLTMAYRFGIDKNVSGAGFYLAILGVSAVLVLIFRRDYVFVTRFRFGRDAVEVVSLFGLVSQRFDLNDYVVVPTLRKGVNIPQGRAKLSFSIDRRDGGRTAREYLWSGFDPAAFVEMSRFYGFDGATDFDLKNFGRP